MNFALIGAAGYIAPRHLKAIRDTGNKLVAAVDPCDSVGIIDSYFPKADFFIEPERFDRHLDKLRRSDGDKVDFVSICSPNYLHDAHIRMALRNQAHAICEKPVVLNPWNVDALKEIEAETGKKINVILQLRLHPAIIELKKRIDSGPADKIYNIYLKYITSRGRWYHTSWKGNVEKSGGLATNIGIHFFDMLSWIFGAPVTSKVYQKAERSSCGYLCLERANVHWQLSVDPSDIPVEVLSAGKQTYRQMMIDGQEVEFSDGFTELHTESYKRIMEGCGFGLDDALNGIEIAYTIRNAYPERGHKLRITNK